MEPLDPSPASEFAEDAEALFDAALRLFSGSSSSEMETPVFSALRQEIEQNDFFRQDMVVFWRLLGTSLARSRHELPPRDELSILNLACGHCEEAAVLSAFFNRQNLAAGGKGGVRFYGMDVRAAEVNTAQRRYQATEDLFRNLAGSPSLRESPAQFEFIAGDATGLKHIREIPRHFDVIFLRHQNVWHDRGIWQRIFEFALARLAPESLLIITSYFDREHLIALNLLKSLGARLLVSEANPNSRPLDYPGKSVDRHMAVFGKA